MRHELARRGVDVAQAYIREAPNPFAAILLDEQQGERVVLWDRHPALNLQPGEIDAATLASARLVHVDDTDEAAALRAAALGRAAGIPVTSDIERVTERTEELVAAVTIPIFAEHVLETLTGERDFERALRKIRAQRGRVLVMAEFTRTGPTVSDGDRRPGPSGPGDDLICVTLGARGAMLLAGDRLYQADGYRVDVVDTTGAGDVFRGAFITALLRGDAPEDILRFANAAAAVGCTRLGAIDGCRRGRKRRRCFGTIVRSMIDDRAIDRAMCPMNASIQRWLIDTSIVTSSIIDLPIHDFLNSRNPSGGTMSDSE